MSALPSRTRSAPCPLLRRHRATAVLLALTLAAPAAAVAQDSQTPRPHGEPVVRSFQLGNADAYETAALLRRVVALRGVSIDAARHTLTVNESAEKIPVIERLIEVADRRPGEAEVAVAVLEVDRAALDAWLAGGQRDAGTAAEARSPHRLAPGELTAFERTTSAAALARPRLAMIGAEEARIRLSGLPAAGTVSAAPGTAARGPEMYRVFEFEGSARIHPEAEGRTELTVEFQIGTRRLYLPHYGDADRPAPEMVPGEFASTVRLASGETFLVTELDPAGLAADRGDRALVVAITPRVVRAPEPIPEPLQAQRVAVEDDRVLAEATPPETE